jgi:hypothetical protein
LGWGVEKLAGVAPPMAPVLARKPAEITDLRDGMTGIRFEQRVLFPLLVLLATKSGALVLSPKTAHREMPASGRGDMAGQGKRFVARTGAA